MRASPALPISAMGRGSRRAKLRRNAFFSRRPNCSPTPASASSYGTRRAARPLGFTPDESPLRGDREARRLARGHHGAGDARRIAEVRHRARGARDAWNARARRGFREPASANKESPPMRSSISVSKTISRWRKPIRRGSPASPGKAPRSAASTRCSSGAPHLPGYAFAAELERQIGLPVLDSAAIGVRGGAACAQDRHAPRAACRWRLFGAA